MLVMRTTEVQSLREQIDALPFRKDLTFDERKELKQNLEEKYNLALNRQWQWHDKHNQNNKAIMARDWSINQ